jgi:hypothetical protein
MCCGDTSIENIQAVGGLAGVSGWGVSHKCHSYQQIYDWAELHRFTNLSSIHGAPHQAHQ